jgi:50S ribosomal protein L16 3-hydroxylase
MNQPKQGFASVEPLSTLSNINIDQFLNEDWHVRPKLFRQAITDDLPLASIDELLELATDDDVEARLITVFNDQWTIKHGPISKLPSRKTAGWTVLIQGLNLLLPQANTLLSKFRFVPDARLDDLMVSYATDGGGVGPHFDSYDVFLLQMHGQRRWRIGAQTDLSLKDGVDLKILKNFQPTEEFVLNPGDMLYLPPHYAHEGVAIGECTTLSIGFRAPMAAQALAAVLRHWADEIEQHPELQQQRFADPRRGLCNHKAEIPADLMQWVQQQLSKQSPSVSAIGQGLGLYLTEPKEQVFFDAPEKALTARQFEKQAKQLGIGASNKTKILYFGDGGFINGEAVELKEPEFAKWFSLLADQQGLTAEQWALASLNAEFSRWVCSMVDAAWLEIGKPL